MNVDPKDLPQGGPAFSEVPADCNGYEGRPGMTLREMAKIAEKADGRDTSDFGAAAKYEAMWRWAYATEMLKARAA